MKRYADWIISYWENQITSVERDAERLRQAGIADSQVEYPVGEQCLALARELARLTSGGDVRAIQGFIEAQFDEMDSGRGWARDDELLSLLWRCVDVVASMDIVPTTVTRSWRHRCFRLKARVQVGYYDDCVMRDRGFKVPRDQARQLQELLDRPEPSPKELSALANRIDRNSYGSAAILMRNIAHHAARFFSHAESGQVGVVTWNMGYRGHSRKHEAAWRWLFEDLRPDIALLQECKPPSWVFEQATVLFECACPGSRRQHWGTALVTKNLSTRRVSLPRGLRSWCVSAEVELNRLRPVLLMSVHNPFFPIMQRSLEGMDITEIKLEHQRSKVWLLDVLFYFLKGHLERPLVVGGDFSYSRSLDVPEPTDNNELFDRIRDEGFVSLHRKFHAADQQTLFKPDRRPHQLDYLYADSSIAARVTECDVVPYQEVQDFSDHAPLVAELDVG